MRCKKCKNKITLSEFFNSVHGLFEKGFCDDCEKRNFRKWADQQIILIKQGKRKIPRIC